MGKYNGRGIDLEIYEHGPNAANDLGVIKPVGLRINGVDCLCPDNAPVKIEGLVDTNECLKATMTVFVRSLKVYGESEPPYRVGVGAMPWSGGQSM